MTLGELKNYRAQFDVYGHMLPLPTEVMNFLFDTAIATVTPVIEIEPTDPRDAVAPAKRGKKAAAADEQA